MGDKFRDKYRIRSTRMPNWDYGWNAPYFITICTGGRKCYFGDIEDEKVKLSEIGILVNKYWLEIPNHFHYVKLDEYMIMPNHVHGIIIIDKSDDIKNCGDVETLHATSLPRYCNDIDKNKNEKWQIYPQNRVHWQP